jgi:hypothetical protein
MLIAYKRKLLFDRNLMRKMRFLQFCRFVLFKFLKVLKGKQFMNNYTGNLDLLVERFKHLRRMNKL